MAVRFLLDELTKEQQEEIFKELWVEEIQSYFMKKKHFAPPPQSIQMWIVSEIENNKLEEKDNKLNKDNEIVKYLHLPYRYACIKFNKKFNQRNNNPFPRMKKYSFNGNLLEKQVSVFEESLSLLKDKGACCLDLHTGFGKTFLSIYLSYHLRLRTVIFLHRKTLLDQWYSTIKERIPDAKISIVDDKLKYEDCDFLICMIRRVDKLPLDFRLKFGTFIVDEAHCLCTQKTVPALLSFFPKYTIIATATPEKTNGLFGVIQTICGVKTITRKLDKAFKVIIINTGLEFPMGDKNIFNDLINGQVNSQYRNEIAVKLITENTNYLPMVIVRRKDHCLILEKLLKEKEIGASSFYGTMKKYTPEHVLIGTVSKIGTGFDEKAFTGKDRKSNLLICMTTFADREPFTQVIGRCMRAENPILVFFRDGDNISKRHITNMKRWSKEFGGEIIEIKNFDDIKKFKEY